MPTRSKTTRGRSRHPGVVLKQRRHRNGRTAWVARYRDPETGQAKERTLDGPELHLTTLEARRDWATRLSRQLAEQRAAIAAGARPVQRIPIGPAVEEYFAARAGRLRFHTVRTYKLATARFTDWCQQAGIKTTDELTGPRLVAFCQALASKPRLASLRKGRRGAQRPTASLRAPGSVNRDLTSLGAMFNAWRRQGWLRLGRDDIADALRPLPTLRTRPQPLKPAEIQALLEAALRHDADTFRITRAEKAGDAESGTTPRHEPVAPLVLFTMLSGCRIGEVASLPWSAVDLSAHEGQGEVVITATASKTRTERAVRLGESPSMTRLLAALKLRSGGEPFVFGGSSPVSADRLKNTLRRLQGAYKGPTFTWQRLRQTCATYLTNSPSIFGAASAFMSATRLGHGVTVAQKHYLGLITVPATAKTLEAAMGIEALAEAIVATVGCRPEQVKRSA